MYKNRLKLRKVIVIAICLAVNATAFAQETGVEINGVTWATRNVDAPNTFAATPQDAGMFYQWNRTAAFSITDPMTSIGGKWADVASPAEEWESDSNVCPLGWRIPTKAEFESLIESGGTWVTTPANGFRFGSGSNTVFFPAAGERFYDGTLLNEFTTEENPWGSYWTSELRSASQPYLLAFDESDAWISYFNGREGYCVRCVKDNTITTYTVTFAGEEISIASQTVIEGGLVAQPADPMRTNYNFEGWFTDNGTFLNEWIFETDVVTSNTTLYAKWKQMTGIADITIAGIEIYPNPVKDVLQIESDELNIKQIEIVNLSGKVIYRFNNFRNQINVSTLPQGIYFVKLKTDKGTVTKKFVKEE